MGVAIKPYHKTLILLAREKFIFEFSMA